MKLIREAYLPKATGTVVHICMKLYAVAHHHSINRAIKTLVIQEIHDELSRNCFPFPCIRPQLRRYVRFLNL
jgi:hypothetical protein